MIMMIYQQKTLQCFEIPGKGALHMQFIIIHLCVPDQMESKAHRVQKSLQSQLKRIGKPLHHSPGAVIL